MEELSEERELEAEAKLDVLDLTVSTTGSMGQKKKKMEEEEEGEEEKEAVGERGRSLGAFSSSFSSPAALDFSKAMEEPSVLFRVHTETFILPISSLRENDVSEVLRQLEQLFCLRTSLPYTSRT